MKKCQGGLLKRAGLTAIIMCGAGIARPTSGGDCRMWVRSQGCLRLVLCSCGMASIWLLAGARVDASYSSTSWTEFGETDMSFVRKQDCVALHLPLPAASGTPDPMGIRGRRQLAWAMATLTAEACQLHLRLIQVDQDWVESLVATPR